MLTFAKTVIGGTIAGLTLLALTANPSIAQTNQPEQQPTQSGCSCCRNMMNNMNMRRG